MHLHQREEEVVERREMGKEVVGLKHSADGLAVGLQARFVALEYPSGEGDAAGHREIEPGEDPQERCFAAAGGADQHQRPDVAGGKREPVEHCRAGKALREISNDQIHG